MNPIELLLLLVIAAICGSLGQALAGGSRGGCLVSIALGFIGALIGRYLADAFDMPTLLEVDIDSKSFPVVWSIIGSALFVAVLGLITKNRKVG